MDFIEFLSPKALQDLALGNAELVKMVANINDVNTKMKGLTTPSGSNDAIKNMSAEYDKQAKTIQKLQLQIEKLTVAKSKSVAKTSEEIVNQRALAAAADRQTKSTSALVGAYANLNAKHQQAKKTLQDLIASQTASSAQIKKAQAEFMTLDARVTKADHAVKVFNRNVGNYPKGAISGIRSLAGAFGLMGGAMLLAQGLKDSFNTIKDFDKANADLAATMGKTRAEIKALTADQARLGASTKYTASEVAGLQKEFAKLGFNEKEILNATEATLALAAAVDTDLANAAMVAGSTLRGFGLDASEMGRVTDVMASSFTKSALDIENFKESMKYVAPIAKASGVSIEYTTAMLGKLADSGVKGSQAGTALRRILAEMAKTGLPTAQAFDKIAKTGISVSDAMDEVGRNAQTALLVLSKSKDGVNELAKALESAGGAAQAMADEQLKSLSGQIDLLTSAWDGFIISLNSGEGVLSRIFTTLIKYITGAINGLKRLSQSQAEYNEEVRQGAYSANLKAETKNYQEMETQLRKVVVAKQRYNLAMENISSIADETRELQKQQEILRERKKGLGASAGIAKLNNQISENTNKIIENSQKAKAWQAVLDAAKNILYPQTEVLEENTEAVGKNAKAKTKAVKELEEVETNSKIAFQRQINFLQSQMDVLDPLSARYGVLAFSLKVVKSAYDELHGSAKKAQEVQDPNYGTLDYYEKLIKTLKDEQSALATSSNEYAAYNEKIKAVQIDIDILIGKQKELNKTFYDAKGYFQSYVDTFSSESGFSKVFEFFDLLEQDFENAEERTKALALAMSEAMQEAFNTISQSQQMNYEAQLQRLEMQKDNAILFAGESATAREEIERQYEERRKKMARERAKEEKEMAIFNAVINTAQAVVAALPNYVLAALVGVIGAAQIALISSQPIPAYAQGTDNHIGGAMLVNDGKGSNYQEKVITPDGKVITPKGRNVMMNAPKGTKVLTNEQWKNGLDNILTDNGISYNNDSQTANVPIINVETKDNYHFNIDERGINKTITRGAAKANIINSRLRIKSKTT